MTATRKLFSVLIGLSLAASACGDDDDTPTANETDQAVSVDTDDGADPTDSTVGPTETTIADFAPLDPMTPADFNSAGLSTAALGATDLDPCAVFDPVEIEAAYGVAVTEQPLTDGCSWDSSPRGFSVRVDLEPSDELTQWAREELEPGVWCCGVNSLGPRYFDEGRVSVSVAVYLPEAGGVSNLSDEASLDLLRVLIPRLV